MAGIYTRQGDIAGGNLNVLPPGNFCQLRHRFGSRKLGRTGRIEYPVLQKVVCVRT
jgi:hypothetical protein